MAEMMRCREGFSYDVKGVPVVVGAGSLRPANHRDVKGRESLFEPVEAASTRESERGTYTPEVASAAPGQARVLSRP